MKAWVWWIVVSYVLISLLWVHFSDKALELAVGDSEWRLRLSIYKGWLFVGVTAVMFWLVLGRLRREVDRGYAAVHRHESEIDRLSHFYAALSQINQSIVWSRTREELLQSVCEALIKHGGFSLAWIGWHDPDSARLVPLAVSGDEDDYIKTFQVFTDDRPEGQGPIARAFRAGLHYVSNDILRDPASKPWLAELQKRRLRSAVFLPLRMEGAVVGMLCVYAAETEVFQERELALLQEAALDITFALDNLKHEAERRQAEAVAEDERRFSATMIDSMPGVFYFYDTAGRFLRWNRNFEQVSGYSGEEISRMNPLDFFSGEERELLSARISEVFEKGESSVEASFVRKDGTTVPYYFTGRRVSYEGRTCLIGVGMDITARLQAEQSLRVAQSRLVTVVNNLREGLIMAEPDGDFLEWNPAALEMLGFTNLEEGRRRQREFNKIFTLHTLEGTEVAAENWPLARVRRGDSFDRLELVVRRREQDWTKIFSYSGGMVHLDDGRRLAFLTLRDITLRKEAEQVLRESRDLLEKQVAERTAELQTALVRAESADRLKSAFLATMSHELRTPLNSIIGFTGILLQQLAGPLSAEQNRQLTMVRGSARHLLDLINDVLDISKIEAAQLTMKNDDFNLRESIANVVNIVRPMAEKKQLELVPPEIAPELGEMRGDRRRVEQILLNLLNNAVKFTETGRVSLSADRVEKFIPRGKNTPQPAVRLAVTDTGIGIRAEDQACLFQPFRQIDTGLTRLHEGTGLGLAICRRLAELMGGTIEVESELGRGSTFTVTLPLSVET